MAPESRGGYASPEQPVTDLPVVPAGPAQGAPDSPAPADQRIEGIRECLPAHYFDCDRFNVHGYGVQHGTCDCTATTDVTALLETVAALHNAQAEVAAAKAEVADAQQKVAAAQRAVSHARTGERQLAEDTARDVADERAAHERQLASVTAERDRLAAQVREHTVQRGQRALAGDRATHRLPADLWNLAQADVDDDEQVVVTRRQARQILRIVEELGAALHDAHGLLIDHALSGECDHPSTVDRAEAGS